jgi:hypothetical protein
MTTVAAATASQPLYLLSKRYLTEPRPVCHARVVVIGASACAVACLETLVFAQQLRLSNVTLVSPGGLRVRTLNYTSTHAKLK